MLWERILFGLPAVPVGLNNSVGVVIGAIGRRTRNRVLPRPLDSAGYSSTAYVAMRALASAIRDSSKTVFVDIGCGDGRVVRFIAAKKRLKKVVGVEILPELATSACFKASLRGFQSPIEIVRADASIADLSEGTIYYFYNPFGALTMRKVLSNITLSLAEKTRRVFLVYFHPVHADLFDRCHDLQRARHLQDELNRRLGPSPVSKAEYKFGVWSNRREASFT